MRITKFGPIDPFEGVLLPSVQTPSRNETGTIFANHIALDEANEVSGWATDDVLARRQNTEQWIEELRIRLSVLNVEISKRARAASKAEHARIEAADRATRTLASEDKETLDAIYKGLVNLPGVRHGAAKRLVHEIAEKMMEDK